MQRLSNLNKQFAKVQSYDPVLNVWDSMNLDGLLTQKGRELKLKSREFINQNYNRFIEADRDQVNYPDGAYPDFLFEGIKNLGIVGFTVKGHGSPELSLIDTCAIAFELAKKINETSILTLVHQCIGVDVIDKLGSEEQRAKFLPDAIKMEKLVCFCLTEPDHGSDASGLETTAEPITKPDGTKGYILNGKKRWVGLANRAGYLIVWAKNLKEDNKVQAFIVEQGTPGYQATVIPHKEVFRLVPNCDISFTDCFVPHGNRLAKALDFDKGTGLALMESRLIVAWGAAGVAVDAYEHALEYTLKRVQFGKPLAKFQLIQERLSRMCALSEAMISFLLDLTQRHIKKQATSGQISRGKAQVTKFGREIVALARECLGGNGIIAENQVMRCMGAMECFYTFEGTYDVNSLVSARELTGGISAIK